MSRFAASFVGEKGDIGPQMADIPPKAAPSRCGACPARRPIWPGIRSPGREAHPAAPYWPRGPPSGRGGGMPEPPGLGNWIIFVAAIVATLLSASVGLLLWGGMQ